MNITDFLPAVTVCKEVLSKAHGTFVCEFTATSELAPPFVEISSVTCTKPSGN